jgi:tRNA-2-methylthio-N6-dimethylallyladenosine synthase
VAEGGAAMPGFSVVTFGCQMNSHDSDRIGEVLRSSGWQEESDLETCDLVILNTCSVREKAEQKLRSEVGRIGMLKARRPSLLIGIAGCVAQQEGEKLLKRMPQVDLLIGPDNISELPELLSQLELGAPTQVRTVFDLDAPRFLPARPAPGRAKVSEFVTVMKGCNERCSFCIVPHTRGPERYRPAREIVEEVAALVAAGTREITLLGQTVNSYRDPEHTLPAVAGAGERPWTHTHPTTAREDESEFPALLRAIVARSPDLARLRYTSPHPRHLTRSLILAHRELPVLARHVHLPVQSGSDRMLKRMLRRYSIAEYKERVAELRREVADLTLSTDVIVGFPGETREDFAATLELVSEIGFSGLFGFKYSPRPYTPALRLDGEPSEEEKSARLEELFLLADGQREAHLETLVGSTARVICEGRGKTAGFSGRSERNEIVHFDAAFDPTGQIVPVRITRAFRNSLAAEPLPAFLEASRADRVPAPEPRRTLPVVA